MQYSSDVAYATERNAKLSTLDVRGETEQAGSRATNGVRRSDSCYRCLFENNLDAVFSLDRDGRFVEANPAAERLSGYNELELRSMDFVELCSVEDRHKAMFFFARAMAGTTRSVELSAVCRDGSCIDLHITGAPIRINGQLMGLFCTARDVTRKRRAEAQLRRARREAEQAKDRFLSVLSHELRTPLMPVLTTVQMLEKRCDLPREELQELLAMMRRNLELEARLIDDLLDLNRIRQGKLSLCLQNVDVHHKIRHVLTLCESEITSKGIAVNVELRAQDTSVTGDTARLNQVLWNIIGNAARFTPEGGSISIVTCNGLRDPACCAVDCGAGKPICTTCNRWRDRKLIAIHVTDTGMGLTEESMRHLFDAFDRVDCESRHGSGRGISLSISKSLVELHGGQLVVHSNGPGKGTTFTIILPVRNAGDSEQFGTPRASRGRGRISGKKVLLVEDHADTAKALSRLLRSSGLTIHVAESVKAAIALAEDNEFDLLISDIGLPDGTGIDVLQHLRRSVGIPAIALSGYGMEEDIQRSREAGFAEHLVKPINIHQLHRLINQLLVAR